MTQSHLAQLPRPLVLVILLIACFDSAATPVVPSIEVSDCPPFPDEGEDCTRTVTSFGSGVTSVAKDYDYTSVNTLGVTKTSTVDIDAAAGGGLEPAFSITLSASTTDMSDPASVGGDVIIRWPYIVEGPDDGSVYSARVNFDYNWSISGSGQVAFRTGADFGEYDTYIPDTDRMSRTISTTTGEGRCLNPNNATFACNSPFEGSGTLSALVFVNTPFYVDIIGQATANTLGIFTNAQTQIAFDPFAYIDPNDPNLNLLSLSTVRGLGDSTLVDPVRGSALGAVPVPGAFWLLSSGLLGLIGIARRQKSYSIRKKVIKASEGIKDHK